MKQILLFLLFLVSINLFAELKFGDIEFEGNSQITNAELNNVIASHKGDTFSNQIINQDIKRIVDFYKAKGILNVKVFYPKVVAISPENIKIIFKIEEGKKLIVNSVHFVGNSYISSDKLDAVIGKNFYMAKLSDRIYALVRFYNENGFFFAKIYLDSTSVAKNLVEIYLNIDEGSYCEFKNFIFKGNKISTGKSLLNISHLDKTQRITPELIAMATENIKRKSYIKDCDIVPINQNDILISVEEGKMNFFNGIIGYDNSGDNKAKLSGFLNFDFLNIAGSDRSVSFRWKNIPDKIKTVSLAYHHPKIYKYPLGADISFFREEKEYIKTDITNLIYYQTGSYKYGTSITFDNIYSKSGEENYFKQERNIKPGLWGEINTTNSYYNPTSGMKLYMHYFVTLGLHNKKRQAVELRYAKFNKIKNSLVFYYNMTANIMQNKELSYFDYYQLGGKSNLRGFLEDTFSGYQVGWSNVELRFLAGGYSSFFLFTDYGYVKNIDYTYGKLFGTGLGMRLETKIGILEVDYAIGYQNGKFRSPLNGIIHFGLSSGL